MSPVIQRLLWWDQYPDLIRGCLDWSLWSDLAYIITLLLAVVAGCWLTLWLTKGATHGTIR